LGEEVHLYMQRHTGAEVARERRRQRKICAPESTGALKCVA
jgi:hypothetical protein